ncbi:DUF1697 domain-containing protein [Cellulomonas massiliensis]|uniref:DUF1697 domain-containing protein n=1 Tax=Cellulomonas massiliensis TaxID=1465811 RepID=UPI00036914CA|nr:DUF1697 domain-containing protein [Cellulomonas massiliensis]
MAQEQAGTGPDGDAGAEPVVALLRAVNVGGRTVRAAELRETAEALGHTRVTSYVTSGNLVLLPAGAADEVGPGLSAALEQRYGFAVPVVTRTASRWDRVVAALPFAEAAREDPAHVVVVTWDRTPDAASVRAFDPTALGDELVVWHRDETYVLYPHGQGRSRLTLAVLEKAAGGRVGTARNWRTALALQALAHERLA